MMPVPDTSATRPWVMLPPAAPSPDTANTRSPVFTGGLSEDQLSRGWLGFWRMSSARSLSCCHVHSCTLSSSPLRLTDTCGPGWWVAACTVLNDVSNSVWLLSDATTNADPTDGWPFWSSVCTNHTDGDAFLRRVSSVLPSAATFCSGSSCCLIWLLALSRSVSMALMAPLNCLSKPLMKFVTRCSFLLSRYS